MKTNTARTVTPHSDAARVRVVGIRGVQHVPLLVAEDPREPLDVHRPVQVRVREPPRLARHPRLRCRNLE